MAPGQPRTRIEVFHALMTGGHGLNTIQKSGSTECGTALCCCVLRRSERNLKCYRKNNTVSRAKQGYRIPTDHSM